MEQNATNRARLYLRIIRYLMSCVPQGRTEVAVDGVATYTDAPAVEVHAVMTAMVRDGLLEWQMFYDCPGCGHANPFEDEQIECGIKNGSLGQCSECDGDLPVVMAAPQLRPEYRMPLWWWSELLPPKVSQDEE